MRARPVAYYPLLAKLCGNPKAGIFLSQALYWSQHTTRPDCWFFKKQEEWTKETGLSRSSQENARRLLRNKGFLREEQRGIPPIIHFQVQREAISKALIDSAKKEHNQLPKFRRLNGGKLAKQCVANQQHKSRTSINSYKEAKVTSENTANITENSTTPENFSENSTQTHDALGHGGLLSASNPVQEGQADAELVWKSIKVILGTTINRHTFETWLSGAKGTEIHDGILRVRVPTEAHLWVKEKLAKEIETARLLSAAPCAVIEFYAELEGAEPGMGVTGPPGGSSARG